MASAIVAAGKHKLTAITRIGSESKLAEGVTVSPVDYDNEQSLVNALRGQQFLIISMSIRAPQDSEAKIVAAAAKAGVPWVMPTVYSPDIQNEKLSYESIFGRTANRNIQAVKDTPGVSWIAMCCSFWYEFSLGIGPEWYGFDFENKTVTFIDDGNTKINTSTWNQCGRAIASLLSLKEYPEDENDKSPTISQWRDSPLYISSFLVSQRDMLDSVHRVLGTTDTDWTIDYEPSDVRYQRGLDMMKQGGAQAQLGFVLCMYTRTFYPNGDGNFEAKYPLANEPLNLPKEDLDTATRRAVELFKGVTSHYRPRE